MIAAITLFLVVTLSALITKVAAIALAHTGLSSESALNFKHAPLILALASALRNQRKL